MSAPAEPAGPSRTRSAAEETRRGTAYGALAFFIWGTFPLFFKALEPASALEILVHRIAWSLLTCLIVVLATRQLRPLKATMTSPRLVGMLAIAAVLIAVNWGVYIAAVNAGHVVEASLGYFFNPLLTVLLGVVILHESLRRLQWLAVGIGLVAVVVLAVDYGRPPWIALVLAVSFGSYGLVKNQVGPHVSALGSLTTETAVLTPAAIGTLIWLEVSGRGTFAHAAPWHGLLLTASGVITTVPLLMFASGARRIPLAAMGLLQFITPVLQLLCGVLVLHEAVPASRWFGFSLVWVALAILSYDSIRASRLARRPAPAPALIGTDRQA